MAPARTATEDLPKRHNSSRLMRVRRSAVRDPSQNSSGNMENKKVFEGKILVADDQRFNIEAYKSVFSQIGTDVCTEYFIDGRQTINRVK